MIKVLSSGFYTTIQDLGRKGNAAYGVSMSGVMDTNAARWANYLLQNTQESAVLEVTYGGCKLEFLQDVYICITGADFSARVDEISIPLNKPTKIRRSSVLSLGKRVYGVRSYIAVLGGFQTPSIIGSRSYCKGITQDTVIKRGDILPIKPNKKASIATNANIKLDGSYMYNETIDAHVGPEFNLLSATQKADLESTPYTISHNNNRMGYQLNEPLCNDLKSMFTSAVLPGTVQLTPSGKLIILMRDCQVTGGYPRILQLTEQSINALAQKTTGDGFKFELNFHHF